MMQLLFHKLSKIAFPRLFKRLNIIFNCVDISDRAVIGKDFQLVHGIGTVIGKCRIGDNVRIYQNVTIGGKAKEASEFPIIEDSVTIYAGSTIIGNIRIGRGAIIGAMSFIDKDIPPYCTAYNERTLILTKQQPVLRPQKVFLRIEG